MEEPDEENEEYFSEEESQQSDNSEMAQIEKEAKIARDSSDSEGEDATEFLAAGQDLDLPSEDSENEEIDSGSDDNMEEYYEELGIKGEKDYTGTEELYKKSKKTVVQKAKEPSAKSKMIDTLIENTKKEPNYKNIVKVIKIVKTLFNKD